LSRAARAAEDVREWACRWGPPFQDVQRGHAGHASHATLASMSVSQHHCSGLQGHHHAWTIIVCCCTQRHNRRGAEGHRAGYVQCAEGFHHTASSATSLSTQGEEATLALMVKRSFLLSHTCPPREQSFSSGIYTKVSAHISNHEAKNKNSEKRSCICRLHLPPHNKCCNVVQSSKTLKKYGGESPGI
jgi:hypothetical protein